MGLNLKTFICGPLENNCYLIYDEISKQAFLVDAPENFYQEVLPFIKKEGLKIGFLLLTHGHFDHIGGLSDFKGKVYLLAQETKLISDPALNGSLLYGFKLSVKTGYDLLQENSSLEFCGHTIKIIATPGHTPGSACFLINNWLFSGDTLFSRSIGRTDVPLGSQDNIIDSLRNKIMPLADSIEVFPGHGRSSTMLQEKQENPFLQGF